MGHEYHKVQAREASSVCSCINTSDLYKSHFTSEGLHPCSLDVALLCHLMRIPRIERCHNSVPRLQAFPYNGKGCILSTSNDVPIQTKFLSDRTKRKSQVVVKRL